MPFFCSMGLDTRKEGLPLSTLHSQLHVFQSKSELDLSLCGLAPAQSQMHLLLDTLCVPNKQRATNFNQSEEAMSHMTASATFLRGQVFLKIIDSFVTALGSPPMP